MDNIIDKFFTQKISITSNNFIRICNKDISYDNPFVKELLEEFNTLMLSYDTQSLYNNIPECITKLALEFEDYTNITVSKLHSGIKELYILGEACPLTNPKCFTNIIENLPSGLEILYIQSELFNQPLINLPHGLKRLIILSNTFNQSLCNLPSSLEYLEITIYLSSYGYDESYRYSMYNLPLNLKTLIINEHYMKNTDGNVMKMLYPEMNVSVIKTTFYGRIDNNNLFIAKSKLFYQGVKLGFIASLCGMILGYVLNKYKYI